MNRDKILNFIEEVSEEAQSKHKYFFMVLEDDENLIVGKSGPFENIVKTILGTLQDDKCDESHREGAKRMLGEFVSIAISLIVNDRSNYDKARNVLKTALEIIEQKESEFIKKEINTITKNILGEGSKD